MHHLIWRFVDREWFFKFEAERARYLSLLGRALEDSDWRCVAYALMSNHIHIAAIAGHEPLARWSRRVNTPFANWMNQRRGRLGPLFADRPRDSALGPIGARELIAYIHNNPVRANVVTRARDSKWTSARAYLQLAHRPGWLHVAEGLEFARMSADELEDLTAEMKTDLPEIDLGHASKEVKRRGSINLATPTANSVTLVARPFARVFPEPRRLVQLVARCVGLTTSIVASRRRDPLTNRARAIAIHAGSQAGLTGAAIASVLGISQQAVSKILRHTAAPPEAADICASLVAETALVA